MASRSGGSSSSGLVGKSISMPTKVTKITSVNKRTGCFGLAPEWEALLRSSGISDDDYVNNPDLVIQCLDYHRTILLSGSPLTPEQLVAAAEKRAQRAGAPPSVPSTSTTSSTTSTTSTTSSTSSTSTRTLSSSPMPRPPRTTSAAQGGRGGSAAATSTSTSTSATHTRSPSTGDTSTASRGGFTAAPAFPAPHSKPMPRVPSSRGGATPSSPPLATAAGAGGAAAAPPAHIRDSPARYRGATSLSSPNSDPRSSRSITDAPRTAPGRPPSRPPVASPSAVREGSTSPPPLSSSVDSDATRGSTRRVLRRSLSQGSIAEAAKIGQSSSDDASSTSTSSSSSSSSAAASSPARMRMDSRSLDDDAAALRGTRAGSARRPTLDDSRTRLGKLGRLFGRSNTNANNAVAGAGPGDPGYQIIPHSEEAISDSFRDFGDIVLYDDPKKFFKTFEELGKGASGIVSSAVDRKTGEKVAVKEMKLSNRFNRFNTLRNEIQLMASCYHTNIIQFKGAYLHQEALWVVMEYVNGYSLHDICSTSFPLREKEISFLMHQLIQALEHMHVAGFIHRDVKARNIMINRDGILKLTDFGFGAQLTSEEERRKTKVGTCYWMAPEVIQQTPYDYRVDIWSAAIVMYEMFKGEPPYKKLPPLKALFSICAKGAPVPSRRMSADCRDFFTQCTKLNMNDRPTATELLRHPFLAESNRGTTLDIQSLVKHEDQGSTVPLRDAIDFFY